MSAGRCHPWWHIETLEEIPQLLFLLIAEGRRSAVRKLPLNIMSALDDLISGVRELYDRTPLILGVALDEALLLKLGEWIHNGLWSHSRDFLHRRHRRSCRHFAECKQQLLLFDREVGKAPQLLIVHLLQRESNGGEQ